jgi:WhiB family redox-sensing transcriptional regulator
MSPNPRPGAVAMASRPDLDWQRHAACKGEDPELFFPPDVDLGTLGLAELGALVAELKRRESAARRICSGCPVRWQCGSYAIAAPEKWGIWGGLAEDERATERTRYLRKLRSYAA